MEAVYIFLGDAHPTLTGRWQPKPPKTLASVYQEHIGRRLFRDEVVRRLPGKAGSWDPADMEIRTRIHPRPASSPHAAWEWLTFLEERDRAARQDPSLAVQEWKHLDVRLQRKPRKKR